MNRKNNFCDGWKFHMGELQNPPCRVNAKTGTCGGASNLTEEEGFIFRLHPYMAAKMRMDNANHLYNVAKKLEDEWKAVELPHDWTVWQEYLAPENWENAGRAVEAGYLPGGVGYYRKRFRLPEDCLGKRIIIEFEGVMRDCIVWVNGCYAGSHLSGYTGFAIDISEYVFFGEEGENVILVKADTSIREGWWTEGAGIYRPVFLYILNPVHIARNGVFVHSRQVSEKSASLQTEIKLENISEENREVTVRQTVYSPEGRPVVRGEQNILCASLEAAECRITLEVANPALWDLDKPNLYVLKTTVLSAGEILDEEETSFGIRQVVYTEAGLQLNGRTVEIKGVCLHQDFAVTGSAVTPDIIRYQLQRIRDMGGNCCRSAHNPAGNEFLKACDEMGILVLNENRRFEMTKDGKEDLEELILGSRNHPCIFMWSLENEELMPALPSGKRLLKQLVRMAHKLDPTRQCTVAGHFACRDEEYVKIPDVAGFNYDMGDAAAMREAVPGLLVMASEDGSFVSTRGEYADAPDKGYCDCYDSGSYMVKMMMKQMGLKEVPVGTLGGASSPNNLVYSWNQNRKTPGMGGLFVWSAFDYRGEAFPWNWPAVTSQYGAMDICGFEKDSFYYWKSLWRNEPVVHVLPHWNWQEGQQVQADVYSNCEEVELFLNGKSLGTKKHTPGMISSWQVDYQPGALEAVAYRGGREAGRDIRMTAGGMKAVDISLLYEGETYVLYKATALDQNGNLCPQEQTELRFTVTGGTILGTANGDPAAHKQGHSAVCRTFHGLALLIVKKENNQKTEVKAERVY